MSRLTKQQWHEKDLKRFWLRVNKDGPIPVCRPELGQCWIWLGYLKRYGKFWMQGQSQMPHRVSYEISVRKIPIGLTLDHLCKNKACVNPMHLEPVTLRENILRSDNPPAINATKTKCPRGHLLKGANLYTDPSRKRRCRICQCKAEKGYRIRRRLLGAQ